MVRLFLLAALSFSISSEAQIGGLLKKITKKEDGKEVKENKEVKETKSSAPESKDDLAKDVPTNGISSPIHQKYLNKIVFASEVKSIDFQKEVEDQFKSEFNSNDPIYYRVYLDNSLFNYMKPLVKNESDFTINTYSSFAFKFYLDNVLLDNLTEDVLAYRLFEVDAKKTWTSFKGAFKTSDNNSMIGVNTFNEILRRHDSKLTTGKHKLKVELYPIYYKDGLSASIKGATIATGEITLNVKGNTIDPNDPMMCMPAAAMTDEQITKSIAKSYPQYYTVNADVVRILSYNWEVERNKNTGIVERRVLDVSVGYKDAKTEICYKRNYLAYQEYVGKRFLDDIKLYTNAQNLPKEISCKCLQSKAAIKGKEVTKNPAQKSSTGKTTNKGK